MGYKHKIGVDGANSLGITGAVGIGILEAVNVMLHQMSYHFSDGKNMMDSGSPGRCTENLHDSLKALVNHNPLGCQFGLDPITNLRRMKILVSTMHARRAISIACFDGGNAAHIGEAFNLVVPIKRCQGILTKAPVPKR